MRKFIAAMMVASAALVGGQAIAADLPYYPPIIEIPDVDYGVSGSFYLRGSAAGNLLWAKDYTPACVVCGGPGTIPLTTAGYGYSFGAGFGYETGTGLRADLTLDYSKNQGLSDGNYTLGLRSTLLLANAYYDFSFSDYGSAAGGFGAYVGAGLGGAYNQVTVTGGPLVTPEGSSWAPAAAVMAGVTYDMGALVADIGYRGIYMPQVSNAQVGPNTSFYLNSPMTHELRTTLRYRFN
ncbi:outer membrane protein [Devosia ginsengisoli]|uniref:Porin family protein n=1 Tax=Devosia ginsengisoli TaxID=400770 RepID=A0A5B8LVH4_9HYPH|nr:outer membrane beta-barrel protein [Devosia ginsengisoli]QDZ11380.1 porin family protein [Devosia ginsengisoli]